MLELGKRLRDLRIQNNLSQQQVAELIGCKRSTIEAYEIDKNNPPAPVLKKLAAQYRTTVDFILGNNTDNAFHFEGLSSAQQILLSAINRKTVAFLEIQNKKL